MNWLQILAWQMQHLHGYDREVIARMSPEQMVRVRRGGKP